MTAVRVWPPSRVAPVVGAPSTPPLTPTAWASRDESTLADDAYFLDSAGKLYQQKANTGPGGSRLVEARMAEAGCVPRYYFDGTQLPSAVSGDWSEVTAGSGAVGLQFPFKLDNFVALTSTHAVTINGTSYPVTAGATEEATFALLEIDIEAGEAGSDLVISGTGPAAYAVMIAGVNTYAAGTNTSISAAQPQWIRITHTPLSADGGYLLWTHGLTDQSWYIRFQLLTTITGVAGAAWPSCWIENDTELATLGWGGAAGLFRNSLGTPVVQTVLTAATERLIEVSWDYAADNFAAYVDGAPVLTSTNDGFATAGALKRLILGDAASLESVGTTLIRELLVCHD